jgi:hypothetical protein
MTPTQISNVFNQILQSYVDMKFYHYGWTSDVNINIKNNFTGDNTRGKKYPALHMDFPSEQVTFQRPTVKTTANINLIFTDTQEYLSDNGATNLRSIVEMHTVLKNLAINVISEFNRLGRSLSGIDNFGVLTNQFTFNYDANANAHKLVRLFTTIQVFYHDICPTLEVDIDALNPPFNTLPPINEDFELK